jgi:hypothetical protein
VPSYVANQQEHHRVNPFCEAVVEMLEKAGVAYDPEIPRLSGCSQDGLWHPFGVRVGVGALETGGIASLNHRLISDIPSGCDARESNGRFRHRMIRRHAGGFADQKHQTDSPRRARLLPSRGESSEHGSAGASPS